MAGFFSKVFAGRTKPAPVMPPLAPDRPFAVIGDVHGRARVLDQLLAKLAKAAPSAELVFVGDLIDRGDRSAEVLHRVHSMAEATCLLGNHERMMLDFLDDPAGRGPRWLGNGGLETLDSFGLNALREDLPGLAQDLRDALGTDMIEWLRTLPLWVKNGNIYVVHAAADPRVPVEEQEERDLIWGTPRFTRKSRTDGHWIVHGHTVVDEPTVEAGRIAIDTGAYVTGRLTAALFAGEDVQFLSAQD